MESLPGYDAWKTRAPEPDEIVECKYCGQMSDECECYCSDCGYLPCGCDEMYEQWKDRKMREEHGIDY